MSNYRHTGLVAGYGSGKTQGGVSKIVIKKLIYVGVNVAYYLPTYNLISDIAIPRITETLEKLNLTYIVNTTKKYFKIYNGGIYIGKIIMRTMDNPSLIVGYEVGYSLIDECDVLPKKKMSSVFKKILSRNRVKLPNGYINSVDVVGTPEGFKWFYEFFITKNSKFKKLIRAKTKDNPFLPDDYIESLKEDYTNEELQAYLDGEFVNLTSGTVYRNFDRKLNHSDRIVNDRDVLHIGMDFNITNMSAIVHVIDGYNITAVDELTKIYDTQEMIAKIKDRYPNRKIVIYPDASGNARKTSGGSDIKLLKTAKFTVRNLTVNPSVKDRITTMNVAFKGNNGSINYKVNTNICIEYTESLEKQTYKNGSPNKDNGFDHTNDAGGYAIFAITKKTTTRIIAN